VKIPLRGLQLLSEASLRGAVKQRQTAAALMRIALGSLTIIFYALHLSQRNFLWGPGGVVSWPDNLALLAESRTYTLYQFFPSALGAGCLYWLGLAVSLMFTVGLFARFSSILFFLFTWSLYQRNWYAIDGGENLLIILAFYLMFADLSALSLDRMLFPKRRERSTQFSLPGWTDLLWRSAALVTMGTYGTILFEMAHPFLLWHARVKWLVFAGAVCLHTGIGVLMGLPWFSLTMISAHAVLFDDAEYLALVQWVRRRTQSISPASREIGPIRDI